MVTGLVICSVSGAFDDFLDGFVGPNVHVSDFGICLIFIVSDIFVDH